MANHAKAASAHRMIGGIYCVMLVLATIFIYAAVSHNPGTVAAMFAVPVAIFAAVHFIVANGADDCRPWARTASIVLGAIMSLGFPIGTIVGVYILKVSLAPWVPEKRLSESLSEGWPHSQQEAA